MSQSSDCQESIENLQKELTDLQGAILDVFSRTGRVRFPSWKFPDELSCDLDMVALLEQYDFVDGEGAFNQHSHIVLLELVIDRLLLLLQSFNSYVERVWRSQRRGQSQQNGFLSVGLVVRNYWGNLLHFVSLTVTQKDSERKTDPNLLDSDETEALAYAFHQMMSSTHCLSARSSASSFNSLPQNHVPSCPPRNTPSSPKVENCTVGCQTTELALIPCDVCHQLHSILRKTGEASVELFQNEGLPSSLQPLLATVEETLKLGHEMTAGDVAQWANVQLGDMRRLGKHLQNVRGTVQPLKERLAAAEAARERFKFLLERAQLDLTDQMEKRQATIDQLELALEEAQRFTEATEQRLREEEQQFKRENVSLEESNATLKGTIAVQQHALQALECEKSTLQETVKAENEACRQLRHKVQALESELSETQVLLDKESDKYHKESDKYHSACQQQESVLMKQQSLLERADALDGEREELQRQLAEKEERRLDLQDELQQMSKEKEQLQARLAQQQNCTLELQKDKQRLETQMGALIESVAELKELVEDLKERERLLVAFPQLAPLSRTQPESTGNVLLDMELQMQANGLRINILERENANLRSSIEKLGERAQHGDATEEDGAAGEVLNTTHKTTKRNATTQASPQQTRSKENGRTLTPNSPQSGGTAWLAYSNKLKEARRVQSGRASVGSRGRMSTAVSPVQIRVQTLNFDVTHSVATKSHITTLSPCLPPHCKGWKQRRK